MTSIRQSPNNHKSKQGLAKPLLFIIITTVFFLSGLWFICFSTLFTKPLDNESRAHFNHSNVVQSRIPPPLLTAQSEPRQFTTIHIKDEKRNTAIESSKHARTADSPIGITEVGILNNGRRFSTGSQRMSAKEENKNIELRKNISRQTRVIQGEVVHQQQDVMKRAVRTDSLSASSLNASSLKATQWRTTEITTNSLNALASCEQSLAVPYQLSPAQQESFIISLLKYGAMSMTDEMFAYQDNGKQYLPIQLLSELLMLPIQLDVETQTLSGWFMETSKTIDVSNNLMTFWGKGIGCNIESTDVYFDDWDLYLDIEIIESMLGVSITFEAARQRFIIEESSHIPLSQIQDRKKRYDVFTAQKNNNNQLATHAIKREDAMIGDLAMNVDLGVSSQHQEGVDKLQAEGFVQARTDMAGHNVYVGYSWSDNDEVVNAYIEKTLTDSWLKHYRVGNITSHSLPLISESTEGLGVRLTAGDGFVEDFRYITIEGEIEPDWDVELYRNNSLISVQRVGVDARYQFIKVPYYIGLNQYQLKFFGPNGETRTESFSKMLDNSVLEKGSVGVSYGSLQREQDDLQLHYVNANWAVTESLTAGLALIKQEVAQGEWLTIPKMSINFLGGENLIQVNFAGNGEGYGTGVVVQGSKGDLDWLADWEYFDNFETWENDKGRLNQQARLNVNGSFKHSALSWALSGNWTDYVLSADLLQFNALISGRLNDISYSNELRWQSATNNDKLFNRIAASGRLSEWYLRTYVDLSISPELELNQWVVNANSSISSRLNYQVELNYQPQAESSVSVRNSITYLFDQSALRFTVDNFSDGDWFAQLKWNSSLLWQPDANLWLLDRVSHLNTGAVKIIAFQDDNANNQFDDNELPISGLSFSGHSQASDSTNEKGELLITHLQTTRPQRLLVKESSLPDPFLIPLMSAITVNPHPGNIQQILYPVLYTSELEGVVLEGRNGNVKPAKGKLVILASVDHDREYKVRVEFDGVFIVDRILPGTYHLSIDEQPITDVTVKPGEYVELAPIHLQ